MDMPGAMAIRKMSAVATAMRTALRAAAEAYANGGGRARPIVDQHFTRGNQGRYGWMPLSKAYFFQKQEASLKNTKRDIVHFGKGKRGSKLDHNAGWYGGRGGSAAGGVGKNAPMLVLTSELRQHVSESTHPIIATPDGSRVTIRFSNLPKYAYYLEHGTDIMPRRSPVQLGPQDVLEVKAVIKRHMDKALGTQSKVPIGTPLWQAGARGA